MEKETPTQTGSTNCIVAPSMKEFMALRAPMTLMFGAVHETMDAMAHSTILVATTTAKRKTSLVAIAYTAQTNLTKS